MDLKTFVTNTLLEIGKDLEYRDKVIKDIHEYAKKQAKDRCAVIDNDEIKRFIVNYDYDNKKSKQEKPKEEVAEKVNDEKHDSFVQTSLL